MLQELKEKWDVLEGFYREAIEFRIQHNPRLSSPGKYREALLTAFFVSMDVSFSTYFRDPKRSEEFFAQEKAAVARYMGENRKLRAWLDEQKKARLESAWARGDKDAIKEEVVK